MAFAYWKDPRFVQAVDFVTQAVHNRDSNEDDWQLFVGRYPTGGSSPSGHEQQLRGYPDVCELVVENKPVVLVGAGPTAREQIHFLRRIQDTALIVCCDVAWGWCICNNIFPRYVVTLEVSGNEDFLWRDVRTIGQTDMPCGLIASTSLRESDVSLWPQEIYVFDGASGWAHTPDSGHTPLPHGGTIMTAAIILVLSVFRAFTIALVGFDGSFDKKPDAMHYVSGHTGIINLPGSYEVANRAGNAVRTVKQLHSTNEWAKDVLEWSGIPWFDLTGWDALGVNLGRQYPDEEANAFSLSMKHTRLQKPIFAYGNGNCFGCADENGHGGPGMGLACGACTRAHRSQTLPPSKDASKVYKVSRRQDMYTTLARVALETWRTKMGSSQQPVWWRRVDESWLNTPFDVHKILGVNQSRVEQVFQHSLSRDEIVERLTEVVTEVGIAQGKYMSYPQVVEVRHHLDQAVQAPATREGIKERAVEAMHAMIAKYCPCEDRHDTG